MIPRLLKKRAVAALVIPAVILCVGLLQVSADVPGRGGLAGLSEDDIKALREVRDFAEKLASATFEQAYIRREAVRAVTRAHEALSDWGTKGQVEWYLKLLLEEKDKNVQLALVYGAMAAARGDNHHLGGVRDLWKKIDESSSASGSDTKWMRKTYQVCIDSFSKTKLKPAVTPFNLKMPQGLVPGLNKTSLKIPDLNLTRYLKPLK